MKTESVTYKEIFEQPQAFLSVNSNLKKIQETIRNVFAKRNIKKVIFTGCGTSLYLAQTSAALFSHYNKIKAQAVPCSELIFHPELYIDDSETLVCPITRKSITTEVRMAINRVHDFKNVESLAITCCEGSSEYNEDFILSDNADEKSIVMTKSFTSMVYLAAIMAMTVAEQNDELEEMTTKIPDLAIKLLEDLDNLSKKVIAEHPEINLLITLGQGVNYGISNECMNKEKEMSLSNSESYYTLEYRHGPMSLVDKNTLLVLLASQDCKDYERNMIEEMKRNGGIVLIVGEKDSNDWSFADYTYFTETGLNDYQLSPVTGIIGQLLGYYVALSKGLNLDAPRHLSQAIVI